MPALVLTILQLEILAFPGVISILLLLQLKMWPVSGKSAEGNKTKLLCSHRTGQRRHRKLAILQKKLFQFLYLPRKVGVNSDNES